jgi:hypothetical protein
MVDVVEDWIMHVERQPTFPCGVQLSEQSLYARPMNAPARQSCMCKSSSPNRFPLVRARMDARVSLRNHLHAHPHRNHIATNETASLRGHQT